MQRRVAGGVDRHPLDLQRIETGDRRHLVEVIFNQQLLQGGEDRLHLDRTAVGQGHLELTFQFGPGCGQVFRIEDAEVTAAADHKEAAIFGNGSAPGLRRQRTDIAGQQPLAVVLPDEDGEIGEVAEKIGIVEFAFDDDPGHAECQGGIGIGLDRQPLVGLGGGAAEIGIDHHHPAPALASSR